ncbi:MAG: DUF5611 family protein [Euryarchaeota archaeon]|nr:DUF5611 family protein [Euryarchaeota archaeon]
MNRYPIKRGHKLDNERIAELLNEYFPCDVVLEDNKFIISYKSLKRMEVWMDEKKLCVDTESNMDADPDDVSDTNKRFRKFLVAVTGYTAKERVKRMKKESN